MMATVTPETIDHGYEYEFEECGFGFVSQNSHPLDATKHVTAQEAGRGASPRTTIPTAPDGEWVYVNGINGVGKDLSSMSSSPNKPNGEPRGEPKGAAPNTPPVQRINGDGDGGSDGDGDKLDDDKTTPTSSTAVSLMPEHQQHPVVYMGPSTKRTIQSDVTSSSRPHQGQGHQGSPRPPKPFFKVGGRGIHGVYFRTRIWGMSKVSRKVALRVSSSPVEGQLDFVSVPAQASTSPSLAVTSTPQTDNHSESATRVILGALIPATAEIGSGALRVTMLDLAGSTPTSTATSTVDYSPPQYSPQRQFPLMMDLNSANDTLYWHSATPDVPWSPTSSISGSGGRGGIASTSSPLSRSTPLSSSSGGSTSAASSHLHHLQQRQQQIASNRNVIWEETLNFRTVPTSFSLGRACPSLNYVDVIVGFKSGDLLWHNPRVKRQGGGSGAGSGPATTSNVAESSPRSVGNGNSNNNNNNSGKQSGHAGALSGATSDGDSGKKSATAIQFNKDGCIAKGRVIKVVWVPATSDTKFLVSFADPAGYLFLFDRQLSDPPSFVLPPSTQSDIVWRPSGALPPSSSFSPSPSSTRHRTPPPSQPEPQLQLCNPVAVWRLNNVAAQIYDFAFYPSADPIASHSVSSPSSSSSHYLATTSRDGTLSVYDWEAEKCIATSRSHYGGIQCVAWSPDGRIIAAGGEDDCIHVWRFDPHCVTSSSSLSVLARCIGHRSWVSRIVFHSSMSDNVLLGTHNDMNNVGERENEEKEKLSNSPPRVNRPNSNNESNSSSPPSSSSSPSPLNYRLTSVGQDGLLIMWWLHATTLTTPRNASRTMATTTAESWTVCKTVSNDSALATYRLSPTPASDVLLLPNHYLVAQSWGGRVSFFAKCPATVLTAFKRKMQQGQQEEGT